MTQSTYDKALSGVLEHEGGYSNDAGDPGGPTKYGITIADVRQYLKADATAADVKALTVDQAKEIYREHYADPIRYDDLPAGVDYAVFDYGINSGISRAAKAIQRIVGATADGKIGDATIAAVNGRDPRNIVTAICDERLAFLQGLRTWKLFGKGWGRRVADVRAGALAMTGAAPQIVVKPPAEPSTATITKWPLQSECIAFYGDPRKEGWLQANTVSVSCPWPLHMDGGITVDHITIHKKCADSLKRVLGSVWDAVGRDVSKIIQMRYDVYDGSHAPRNKRGGTTMSMHYFAAAIDWDAKDNQQHSQHHLFTDQSLLIVKFKEVGWVWGGDWSPGSIDAMHVQAARIHN